jgi:hypothetical protein
MSTHFYTLAKPDTKQSGIPGGFVRLGALLASVAAVGAVVAVTFAPVAAPALPAMDPSIPYVDGRPELSTTSAPSDFWAHTWDGIDARPAVPYGHNGDQIEAQLAAQPAVVPPAQGYETYDVIARSTRNTDLPAVDSLEASGGAIVGAPVLADAVPFDEARSLAVVPAAPVEADAPRYVVRETHQGYEGALVEPPSMMSGPPPSQFDT